MKNKKDSKVALISGGNGFIGKNLAYTLKTQGFEVALLPRESLVDPRLLIRNMLSVQPSHVFHLASFGNHNFQTGIDEIVTTNYLKTFFMLKASMNVGVTNFINFSTSSIYGTYDKPLTEDTLPTTDSFYGATKLGAEYLVNAFNSANSYMNTVNIRPFSVYGEGEAMHRFIPTVIDSILNKKILTLYEKPVHDWIYIEDFLTAVLKVVDNMEALSGSAINIGTGRQLTNKQVYDAIVKIAGKSPLEVEVKDSDRKYDTTTSWVADNSILKSLGWKETNSLEQGLRYTFEYYSKINDLDKTKSSLANADMDTVMDTLAEKYGTGWEDIPEEDKRIII